MSTSGPDDDALEQWLGGAATAPPADLARFIDAMRSAPTAPVDESARRAVVDQMASVLTPRTRRPLRGRPMFNRFSRRSAALAFVGTLAFGGAAVAATGGRVLNPVFGEPSRPSLLDNATTTTADPADTTTTSADDATTTTVDPNTTTTTEPDDDTTTTTAPSTTPTTVSCADAPNHGAWVSQAAHQHDSSHHGKDVSKAAHSDCGKSGDDGDQNDGSHGDGSHADGNHGDGKQNDGDADDSGGTGGTSPSSTSSSNDDHGHGSGNGQGHGHGDGQGHGGQGGGD